MFRPNREFQAGLNLKQARREREKSSLSLRRKDREIKLQKKRSKIKTTKNEYNNNQQQQQQHNISNDDEEEAQQILLLQNLPRFVEGCFTEHKATIFECCQKIRKLLSFSKRVPIKEVIDSGIIPRLIQFLRWNDCPDLQFEAMWVLTNIASSDKPEYTAKVVRDGAIKPFMDILNCPSYKLQDQAIWALGNIAGDCVELRDMMINKGVLPNVLTLCQSKFNEKYSDKNYFDCNNNKISSRTQFITLLKNLSWSVSNFCRYGGHNNDSLSLLLQCLYHLLKQTEALNEDNNNINNGDDLNESFGGNIGWSFYYLTNNIDFDSDNNSNIGLIEIMNEKGITLELIKLLNSNNMYTVHPILRCIGNILTGNDKYTDKMIEFGLLPNLYKLLKSHHKNNNNNNHQNNKNYDGAKLKEICWAISNITAGTETQIIHIINNNFFPILIDILQNSRSLIASEALWAISNATSTGNRKIMQYLVANGLIIALCRFFKIRFNFNNNNYTPSQEKILMVSLETIENILTFDNDCNNHDFAVQFETNDGLNFLEYLQSDDKISQSVYDKTVQIIRTYFGEQQQQTEGTNDNNNNNFVDITCNNNDNRYNGQFGFGLNNANITNNNNNNNNISTGFQF